MSKDLKLSGVIALGFHLSALFLSGTILSSKPVFDIERAPSSIEIFLVPTVAKVTSPTPQKVEKIEESKMPVKKEEAATFNREAAAFLKQGAISQAMPNYLKNRPPVYPRLAIELGYEGTIILNVEVSSEGRCANIQIVKSAGYSILDNAALKAVRQWSFKPASLLNRPISSRVEIPITFRLITESATILGY
jgi:protein TonB